MGAAEVVCDGVPFGEGPVWCPDGTLVVTSVTEGSVYRVWPEQHRASRFADTGGGANGAALAADGSIVVTQNGGFDFGATGLFPDPPPYRPAAPGLQLVQSDGAVSYLTDMAFSAPNDLAVAGDGAILFTDPPHYPPPTDPAGRIMRFGPDGSVAAFATGFTYCNGIAFEPDGTLVVVEGAGLQRVDADGGREWVIETLGRGAGDGFCVDVDGRFYVASTIEHGIRVVDRDGDVVEFLPIDGDGLTTNCCFGGPDLRTLYVTDAMPGRVVAFEAMPTAGLPLPLWPGRGAVA
jgi:gluconolactonase